jgi:hypothetical protein
MVPGKITDGDVTELVRSTAEAASAYIQEIFTDISR